MPFREDRSGEPADESGAPGRSGRGAGGTGAERGARGRARRATCADRAPAGDRTVVGPGAAQRCGPRTRRPVTAVALRRGAATAGGVRAAAGPAGAAGGAAFGRGRGAAHHGRRGRRRPGAVAGGRLPVLRKADGLGFEVGADWREDVVGTNGVGTPAVVRRPVQVFAAEHFVRSHTSWTCTGAPITDPRDGRLLGVVDVSGPLETMHPATLAWVDSVAKLAEARLRELHLASLERLRAVAAPVLARLAGRAVVVDRDGWAAAVTGMPYVRRVALPKSLAPGHRLLPSLGACAVEPLAGVAAAGGGPAGRPGCVPDRAGPRRAGPAYGHGHRLVGVLVAGVESAPRGTAVPARRIPRRARGGGAGRGSVRRPLPDGDRTGGDVQDPAVSRGTATASAVSFPRRCGSRGRPAGQPVRPAPAVDGTGGGAETECRSRRPWRAAPGVVPSQFPRSPPHGPRPVTSGTGPARPVPAVASRTGRTTCSSRQCPDRQAQLAGPLEER